MTTLTQLMEAHWEARDRMSETKMALLKAEEMHRRAVEAARDTRRAVEDALKAAKENES